MTDDEILHLEDTLTDLAEEVTRRGLPRHILSKIQALQDMIHLVIVRDD